MSNLFITPQGQKDLKKISLKDRLKIRRKLKSLENNSLVGKKLGGKLKGYYSFRIWPYRVIYEILKGKVWVVHILHRQQAYK